MLGLFEFNWETWPSGGSTSPVSAYLTASIEAIARTVNAVSGAEEAIAFLLGTSTLAEESLAQAAKQTIVPWEDVQAFAKSYGCQQEIVAAIQETRYLNVELRQGLTQVQKTAIEILGTPEAILTLALEGLAAVAQPDGVPYESAVNVARDYITNFEVQSATLARALTIAYEAFGVLTQSVQTAMEASAPVSTVRATQIESVIGVIQQRAADYEALLGTSQLRDGLFEVLGTALAALQMQQEASGVISSTRQSSIEALSAVRNTAATVFETLIALAQSLIADYESKSNPLGTSLVVSSVSVILALAQAALSVTNALIITDVENVD